MPLLSIRNLTVEFATSAGRFRAVDSVDLDVDGGEVMAIVGESGSGKSVSMLALMGLLPWTATVTADLLQFDGHDLSRLSANARRRIIGKDRVDHLLIIPKPPPVISDLRMLTCSMPQFDLEDDQLFEQRCP